MINQSIDSFATNMDIRSANCTSRLDMPGEDEDSDKWVRTEIEASLSDPAPSIPHDRVFAEMDALIAAKRTARDRNENV